MGISSEQLAALEPLCVRYRLRRLGLFGSAATGAFDPSRSDVDLTVEFDAPEAMGLAEQFFGFQMEAAEILGRDVDLLERGAIRNPYLRRANRSSPKTGFWRAMPSRYSSKSRASYWPMCRLLPQFPRRVSSGGTHRRIPGSRCVKECSTL